MLATLLDDCEAVLFDFDGVIADSEPYYFECYSRAFAKKGHRIDREEYWKYWTGLGEGAPGEIRRHKLPYTQQDLDEILAWRRESYSQFCREGKIRLFPGMMEAAAALVAAGKPCAIASNSFEDDIHQILAHGGVTEPPCPVIGRRKGLRTKPAPDILIYSSGVLQCQPAGCLVIEDAPKGLEGAKAAGMACAIVKTPYTRHADFTGADAILESHEEFLGVVRKWVG